MDIESLQKLWKEALQIVEEVIRITKASGLQNNQEMLNNIDKLNKLSVEF